jgi:trans-2,3-dihydro-3-hydroxyanthranilate isomerase
MRRYRFIQLDVFTDAIFGGNQLAVFPEASGLSEAEMQALAGEMNYAESTFVLPATDAKALRRVRIFTPATELPFAGHPVVGTTFALAYEGVARDAGDSPIYLELGVGTLPVDLLFEGQRLSFVWMHQLVPTFQPFDADRGRLATALGLEQDDLVADLPIEIGSAGVPFVYVPVRSLEALARARPGAGLADIIKQAGERAGAYVFSLERLGGESGEARSRMFAPLMGIAEDAATGSAAGPFGVYLLRHSLIQADALGDARLRILQGVEMGRSSRLDVALQANGDMVRDVRVGGESVVVAEGEVMLPDVGAV